MLFKGRTRLLNDWDNTGRKGGGGRLEGAIWPRRPNGRGLEISVFYCCWAEKNAF